MALPLLLALLLCGSGCAAPRMIDSREAAHVVICPGIGGDDPFIARLGRLIEAGVPHATAQVWDWTRIEPRLSILNLANLQDYKCNQRRAGELARQLVLWRKSHPQTRLYLVGFSGGTGIILFTCAKLPEDFAIERVVFLASGLSPGADLTPLLRRSRRGLVNFHSAGDTVMLRDFTTRHGTMDRQYGPAAGFQGFHAPRDAALAAKLTQIAWTAAMKSEGHGGDHIGPLAAPFVRRRVLPLLDASPPRGD